MREEALLQLEPLLRTLRGFGVLEEARTAAFHLDGRDFLHFHDEPDGLYADVRLARGRARLPVNTPGEQAELLARLDDTLSSLEDHRRKPGRGDRRRTGR